jgi:hypothetical protein
VCARDTSQLDAVRNTESVTPAGASGSADMSKFMDGAGMVLSKSESPLEDDCEQEDDDDDDEFEGHLMDSPPHADLNFDEMEQDAVSWFGWCCCVLVGRVVLVCLLLG